MATTEITHRTYGNAVAVSLSFEEALLLCKEALRNEGFGVLCEIDVAKTLQEAGRP